MSTSESDPSKAVAPVKPAEQAILPAWFAPSGGIDYWTSIKITDDASEELVYTARQGEAEQLGEHIGETILLADVLVHQVQITTDIGELVDTCRIVLITDEGKCYGTCSQGVRKSLMTLFGTRGLPPYNPPVAMKCKQIASGKNRYFVLERSFAPKPAKPAAKPAKPA